MSVAPDAPDETGTVAAAERLAAILVRDASSRRRRRERAQSARLTRILATPAGRELILALTDEVLRIHPPRRAARVLSELAHRGQGAAALGPLDRTLLSAAQYLGPILPELVVPAIRKRVRAEMGEVILSAGRRRLVRHAARRAAQGIRLNVNVLGEAILGEQDAERRLARVLALLGQPSVDYVSVKVSSICPQIDVIRFNHEVERISARLRRLYDQANGFRPPKFVNLDMEEFGDLELTLAVFQRVLDEEPYASMGAGIVLQAYLPDSLSALEELCRWARARYPRSGGWIKVRLVKGANLAMEHVEAEVHGWPSAPFLTKEETDAQYKRLLDVALDPINKEAVKIGVASHNLFELAWAATLAEKLDATDRIEFEMLEGMTPATAEAVAARFGNLRLYAPMVEPSEIETAIAYLVRRLDENSAPENFLPHQFSMEVASPIWRREAERFRRAVEDRHCRPPRTRRTQDRTVDVVSSPGGEFANEPDTDFVPLVNRRWAQSHLDAVAVDGLPDYRPVINGRAVAGPATEIGVDPGRPDRPLYHWRSAVLADAEAAIAAARLGQRLWADRPPEERRQILLDAADTLVRARGRMLAVMAYDTGKTLREGDPEVSEAIDFARYYAEHVSGRNDGFEPYGTVVVASPWNFPLSIPAGGVLGALAAGNAVILKPSSEAVAVAGELSRALWEAGVPASALHFVPSRDRAAARTLITHPDVDAVVLTGSWETARMFLEWRPRLRLHAETSGKNAIVVTATADLDEAIADLVRSAFGHAGQKCSAASLAIVEASVYDDRRFLRRVADAVRTLHPGPGWDPVTSMGPLIRPPEGALRRALSSLEPPEKWLVRPEPLDERGYLWRPGVKIGVAPGSWFHRTECFGPVLGIMRAPNLEDAIRLQNDTPFGLTAGLHALDPVEIERWRAEVEAGNLYVNRGITGAIVGRQPFGGWKRSVVGSGAKAGGPNYVASLGRWEVAPEQDEEQYASSCREQWQLMRETVDPSGLAAESNVFQYRPLRSVLLCGDPDRPELHVRLALAAATAVGTRVTVVSPEELKIRMTALGPGGPTLTPGPVGQYFEKVRLLCDVEDAVRLAAIDAGLSVDDTPVLADPRRELQRWTREQAVSESRHRHGDITSRRPGLAGWPPASTCPGPGRA
jgi:RHH-type transcriptional regulator, proline utilization regulon repressor / proline dehydrogenase / delta 1-pyrroline-5-carboxylate dehydrogenase